MKKRLTNLVDRFQNTRKFFNGDLNKLCPLFWKRVYPYKYMGNLQRFNETPVPKKTEFYSSLTTENITDVQ